jgi:hypothetical protein
LIWGNKAEDVLDVQLALALKERGLVAVPEQHLSDALPNVLVSFNRLMLAIEGKVEDQRPTDRVAWRQAQERVEGVIAHLIPILAPLWRKSTFWPCWNSGFDPRFCLPFWGGRDHAAR